MTFEESYERWENPMEEELKDTILERDDTLNEVENLIDEALNLYDVYDIHDKLHEIKTILED